MATGFGKPLSVKLSLRRITLNFLKVYKLNLRRPLLSGRAQPVRSGSFIRGCYRMYCNLSEELR